MSKAVVLLVGKSSISSKSYNLELSGCYKCFHFELFSFFFPCLNLSIMGKQTLFFFGCLTASATFTHLFYSVPVILLTFLITLCSNPVFFNSSIMMSCKNTEESVMASVQSQNPVPGARQSTYPEFQIHVPKKELLEIFNESSWEDCNIFHGLSLKKKTNCFD